MGFFKELIDIVKDRMTPEGTTRIAETEDGKVLISVRLNENGDLYNYGAERIMVSEVATARFFLNELLKKRKQIFENKKLAKIQEDF